MIERTETENETTLREFQEVVNMSARELERWLKTRESKAVGMKESEDGESVGHQSGRQIVELLKKETSDYTEADYSQMRRVISYVRRHSAQRPASKIEHSRWRYSLKNWGHDPLHQ
ncbi:MAG: DUF3140 domain-containing protein [Cyanosarcina radialis HA8281-LM2]|jgi:DNA topoisomerase VI subunit B|nr:DUF3140 domain-containing protein [Cyanosarcina radialis HA8281-LM2]